MLYLEFLNQVLIIWFTLMRKIWGLFLSVIIILFRLCILCRMSLTRVVSCLFCTCLVFLILISLFFDNYYISGKFWSIRVSVHLINLSELVILQSLFNSVILFNIWLKKYLKTKETDKEHLQQLLRWKTFKYITTRTFCSKRTLTIKIFFQNNSQIPYKS